MKSYRKRFILITMALVETVLLISFTFLCIILYKMDRQDLKNTMQQALRPADRYDLMRGKPPHEEPTYEKYGTAIKSMNSNIITIFADKEDGSFFILTQDYEVELIVSRAVEEVISFKDSFGLCRNGHVIYYRGEGPDVYQIALVGRWYFLHSFLKKIAFVVVLFLLIAGGLWCVSIWLSRYAVRPMEEAMEREERFVTSISHDLKTPLTVIKMNNMLIARSPQVSGTELIQWTESTGEAVERMQNMIEQMMELSELEQNFIIPLEKGIDVSRIVKTLVKVLEPIAAEKNVAMIYDDVHEQVEARTNADYASRIVAALLDNAIKYEPNGGEIFVSLHAGKRGGTELEIRNKESRIDPEDIDHIFDRFWRADKARSSIGHGLGLPIAKKTAELMGAEITARSGEGGTVFTVVFPN